MNSVNTNNCRETYLLSVSGKFLKTDIYVGELGLKFFLSHSFYHILFQSLPYTRQAKRPKSRQMSCLINWRASLFLLLSSHNHNYNMACDLCVGVWHSPQLLHMVTSQRFVEKEFLKDIIWHTHITTTTVTALVIYSYSCSYCLTSQLAVVQLEPVEWVGAE